MNKPSKPLAQLFEQTLSLESFDKALTSFNIDWDASDESSEAFVLQHCDLDQVALTNGGVLKLWSLVNLCLNLFQPLLQGSKPFLLNLCPLLKSSARSGTSLDIYVGQFQGEAMHFKLTLLRSIKPLLDELRKTFTKKLKRLPYCLFISETLKMMTKECGNRYTTLATSTNLPSIVIMDSHVPIFVDCARQASYNLITSACRNYYRHNHVVRPFLIFTEASEASALVVDAEDDILISIATKIDNDKVTKLFVRKIKTVLKIQVGRKWNTKETIVSHISAMFGEGFKLRNFVGSLKVHVASTLQASCKPATFDHEKGSVCRLEAFETLQQRDQAFQSILVSSKIFFKLLKPYLGWPKAFCSVPEEWGKF